MAGRSAWRRTPRVAIYACDPVRAAVLRWSAGTDPDVWTSGTPELPMTTPNWGAFGPDGTYYVSDSGGWKARDGRIYVVRRGRHEALDLRLPSTSPTGWRSHPTVRELWVLESTPGRLVAFAIGADGSAGPMRVITRAAGNGARRSRVRQRWLRAHRLLPPATWSTLASGYRARTVAADPEGTVLAAPTNCAFVGPDLGTVMVPNIGRWHVTRFAIPGISGAPLFYPTPEQLDESRGEADT